MVFYLQIFPDYRFQKLLTEFERTMSMELGKCMEVSLFLINIVLLLCIISWNNFLWCSGFMMYRAIYYFARAIVLHSVKLVAVVFFFLISLSAPFKESKINSTDLVFVQINQYMLFLKEKFNVLYITRLDIVISVKFIIRFLFNFFK